MSQYPLELESEKTYIYDDRENPVENRPGHDECQHRTGDEYSQCVSHGEGVGKSQQNGRNSSE
jgi:hypothetical protein